MACEYLSNAVQSVALNTPIIFNDSIPCRKGYIYHEDGTGIFILRGIVNNNRCNTAAQYQVTYEGNIAIPTGGTAGPIAVAITVGGEPKLTSRAIYTPTDADVYDHVTSTAIIKVPRGCCFSIAIEAVSGLTEDPTGTPAPLILAQNNNLVITRIAEVRW